MKKKETGWLETPCRVILNTTIYISTPQSIYFKKEILSSVVGDTVDYSVKLFPITEYE